MDARLDPGSFAGLKEGDAHVIRDAGIHDLLANSLETAVLGAQGFNYQVETGQLVEVEEASAAGASW